MKNNKGFTLTEVMVVVIVIGILVALSIPYLIGYVREAKNDRAKAMLYVVAQGYRNFKTDYPSIILNSHGPLVKQNNNTNCTPTDLITQSSHGYSDLIKCSYIPNKKYSDFQYDFYIGGSTNNTCTNMTSTALAYMIGTDTASDNRYNTTYCAYIDRNNTLHEICAGAACSTD